MRRINKFLALTFLLCCLALCVGGCTSTSKSATCEVEVVPVALDVAFRNPMKGFTARNGGLDHPLSTTTHVYLKWNEIEESASDGVDKIKAVCNEQWAGVEQRNIKVIPRVYLHWSADDQKYWPEDMVTDDYQSEQFQDRLRSLVAKLGECWNDDPRVAFVELGIFGKWGEHHSPEPSDEMQQLAGELFTEAFPDKQVSVRQVWKDFEEFEFGEYWDSWAHYNQMYDNGGQIDKLNKESDFYLTRYVGGEAAYDWGDSDIQPGPSPTASVRDAVHREFIINSINWLHCTQLRWIDDYDQSDADAVAGAQEIQKAMGYRYVINKFKYSIDKHGRLDVSFDVVNVAAAPFYYDWPVQVALLDYNTKQPKWSATMESVDIRHWRPGGGWTEPEWNGQEPSVTWCTAEKKWAEEPAVYCEQERFDVDIADGKYIIALSVLDPASQLPSLRFATANYLSGGYHPMGVVEVGGDGSSKLPSDFIFDDIVSDETLHY